MYAPGVTQGEIAMRPTNLLTILLGCTFGASLTAHAHHSYAEYDQGKTVEIEGTIVKVAMQNPHVHFAVEGKGANGQPSTWYLEVTSLNWIRRIKAPMELFTVGSHVKFAGWPSKRSADRLYALNMLAANGQEVLLFRDAKPRWRTTAIGFGTAESQSFFQAGVASGTTSLFHVWASNLGDPKMVLAPTAPLALTPSAKAAVAAFDGVKQLTLRGCTPKGMPLLMGQPPPMEFIDKGDTILLQTEEYETVRRIHMTASANVNAQPRTPLGYSVGRWDGSALVVETSRVDSPYLTSTGVPLSPDVRFTERFTPSADGSRLDYSLIVNDPGSLSAPAEFRRYWVWRPGERVLPYKCKE
jgi:hypothetical protein